MILEKKPIYAGKPVEGAPYSPGIQWDQLVFVSGQIHMDPATGEVLRGDFEGAVRLCLENVQRILAAAGTDLDHCLKMTVFLADMNNFSRLNAVYNGYFADVKPARSCIQVARLPLDADVEIEAIATLK